MRLHVQVADEKLSEERAATKTVQARLDREQDELRVLEEKVRHLSKAQPAQQASIPSFLQ